MDNYNNVFIRDPTKFSELLKYVVDQVTINEVANIVGSSAFLAHQYPSDVDVFEKVTVNQSRELALQTYENQFKNIIQRVIINGHLIIFNDFKAGEDRRFDYQIEEITPFPARQEIIDKVAPLLPPLQVSRLQDNISDYETFNEIIRDFRVLRWSPQDLLSGNKLLVDGTPLSLSQALGMDAVVKLDVISWIYGRFHSIEIFYNLRYVDGDRPIDFFPLGSYIQSLYNDILKYSSSKYYAPLRLAKRLWTLAMKVECKELLDSITPLLRSDVAALNQMTSDMEVLDIVIDSNPIYPDHITSVFVEILSFSKRAINHLADPTLNQFEQLVDTVYPLWVIWRTTGYLDKEKLHSLIEDLRVLLIPVIITNSDLFIRELAQRNIKCHDIIVGDQEGIYVKLRDEEI